MNKFLLNTSILFSLLSVLVIPSFVLAAPNTLKNLGTVGSVAGYASSTNTSLAAIAGTIVSTLLSLLGVIFIILIVYAGIIWMTAQGEEAKVEKAQKILKNAIIGLILTVSAYAIYYVIHVALMGQPLYDMTPG
jgi:hypothetical protein